MLSKKITPVYKIFDYTPMFIATTFKIVKK